MNETFKRESRMIRKYNWRRKKAGLKRVTKEMKKWRYFLRKSLEDRGCETFFYLRPNTIGPKLKFEKLVRLLRNSPTLAKKPGSLGAGVVVSTTTGGSDGGGT